MQRMYENQILFVFLRSSAVTVRREPLFVRCLGNNTDRLKTHPYWYQTMFACMSCGIEQYGVRWEDGILCARTHNERLCVCVCVCMSEMWCAQWCLAALLSRGTWRSRCVRHVSIIRSITQSSWTQFVRRIDYFELNAISRRSVDRQAAMRRRRPPTHCGRYGAADAAMWRRFKDCCCPPASRMIKWTLTPLYYITVSGPRIDVGEAEQWKSANENKN